MIVAAESLDGWGNYCATRVRRDGEYSTQWRTGGEGSDGSTAGALRVPGLNPSRQKLTRMGNVFRTEYVDANGDWKLLDENVLELDEFLLVGFGVCSHDAGEIATGTFGNIDLQLLGPASSSQNWELFQ